MSTRNQVNIVDEIKSRCNIVDVIGRVVPLKKREVTIRAFVRSTMKRHLLLLFRKLNRYSLVSGAEPPEMFWHL